ncbi:hypothetical protein PCANC_12488 [Puccinia coronata f. sp. avenae]|uniref:Uncharacterized protein n=1 Tax=Puccinia coronata f. sp. avenae TaxID=200324 RepID=A0A2N5UL63_9BASI|nr:hypothetical protein PCANC_27036 [Puccinia coronata f. sp. avenae]PLW38494.1 hypothetical protein PCANC_12488 [Puccinia coronata f. sp. avenae]
MMMSQSLASSPGVPWNFGQSSPGHTLTILATLVSWRRAGAASAMSVMRGLMFFSSAAQQSTSHHSSS